MDRIEGKRQVKGLDALFIWDDGGFTWAMIDIGEKYVTFKRYLGDRTNRA